MRKNKKAFTIIEVVMTIIVMGTLSVFAVAIMPDISSLRIDTAARRIQTDIRYAQSLAVSTQRWTRISFSAINDNYSLYLDNSGVIPSGWTLATHPLSKENYTVQLNSGDFANIDLTTVLFNSNDLDLVFDQWGNPYSYTGSDAPLALNNPAYVRLVISSGIKDVNVERGTGRVYIE